MSPVTHSGKFVTQKPAFSKPHGAGAFARLAKYTTRYARLMNKEIVHPSLSFEKRSEIEVGGSSLTTGALALTGAAPPRGIPNTAVEVGLGLLRTANTDGVSMEEREDTPAEAWRGIITAIKARAETKERRMFSVLLCIQTAFAFMFAKKKDMTMIVLLTWFYDFMMYVRLSNSDLDATVSFVHDGIAKISFSEGPVLNF